MKNTLISLTLLLAAPVFANDYVATVERAFSNISSDFHQEWAFTEITTEDGVTIAGRYDPRLPDDERWRLITTDGREPTIDEVTDYQGENEDRFRGHDDNYEFDFVAFDSIRLLGESEEYRVFGFAADAE